MISYQSVILCQVYEKTWLIVDVTKGSTSSLFESCSGLFCPLTWGCRTAGLLVLSLFYNNKPYKESAKVHRNKNLKESITLNLQVNINPPTFSHHFISLVSLRPTSQRRHRCNHTVFPPVHPGGPGRHARVHSQNQRARQAETAQDVQSGHVQLIGGQWQQHRVQVTHSCQFIHFHTFSVEVQPQTSFKS